MFVSNSAYLSAHVAGPAQKFLPLRLLSNGPGVEATTILHIHRHKQLTAKMHIVNISTFGHRAHSIYQSLTSKCQDMGEVIFYSPSHKSRHRQKTEGDSQSSVCCCLSETFLYRTKTHRIWAVVPPDKQVAKNQFFPTWRKQKI